jgi:regulatory protein YycH of two-component signal transduction system YycFG
MTEKIKSLLLIILVALSLLLTYKLWYGQQPAELIAEDTSERIVVELQKPLEEVVSPAFAAVTTADGYYLLSKGDPSYDKIWGEILDALSNYDNSSSPESNPELENAVDLITFFCNPVLPSGQGSPWLPAYQDRVISTIKLLSDNSGLWLAVQDLSEVSLLIFPLTSETEAIIVEALDVINDSERTIHRVLDDNSLQIDSQLSVSIASTIFVPAEPFMLSRILLYPEEVDRDLLLKTFFVDYNLARIIEEKDGSLIYTDGEKGLRLSSVSLEYSNPRLEEGRVSFTYLDALKSSNNLFSYHGGWPNNVRIESLTSTGWRGSLSYVVQWRMYFGLYPLYTSIPTKAIFNDRGLVHYSRSLYFSDTGASANSDQVAVAEWQDALGAALERFSEELPGYNSTVRLEAIHPGYAVTVSGSNYIGEPVWYIQLNGRRYFLRSESLAPLNEEDFR